MNRRVAPESCSPFPVSEEIGPEDYEALIARNLEYAKWVAAFSLQLPIGRACLQFCSVREEALGMRLTVPQDAALPVSTEVAEQCAVKGGLGNTYYTYPPSVSGTALFEKLIDAQQDAAFPSILPPTSPLLEQRPQVATVPDVADALMNTDPDSIIFYTGAGISNTSSGAWDHQQFMKQVGFSDGATASVRELNRHFIQGFLSDPEKSRAAFDVFRESLAQRHTGKATEAHIALARIIRTLGRRPIIFTTNTDTLQEAAGIISHKVFSNWNSEAPLANPERMAVWALLRRTIEVRVQRAELVIVVGASDDYCGLLSYIKSVNPHVGFIACNQTDALPYLSETDKILQGDCQVTLPALHEALAAKRAESTQQ